MPNLKVVVVVVIIVVVVVVIVAAAAAVVIYVAPFKSDMMSLNLALSSSTMKFHSFWSEIFGQEIFFRYEI